MTDELTARASTGIKKVTIRHVCGEYKNILPLLREEESGRLHIFRVVGEARRYEDVPTDYGLSYRFVGRFLATNALTGEMFHSAKCFLPEVASDDIVLSLQDESIKSVEFAYDIFMVAENNPVGFTYQARPLKEPSHDDSLARLSQSLPPLAIKPPTKPSTKALPKAS